jgi:hypothetical protein
MTRGKASGYKLTKNDAFVVLGMVARGDRDHDIAAWFGVNQGRIAEVKEGKFGSISAAPVNILPPKGSPGVKGRRLRAAVEKALNILIAKGSAGSSEAASVLSTAKDKYDSLEA